jgi:5-methylcytosine-specific restriction enzyme A
MPTRLRRTRTERESCTCLTKATMRWTSDGRPSARKRGYTVRWEKAARRFLLKHPVCTRFGKDKGCTAIAQHVDHVTPHSGDLRLFWDRRNWQGLCQPCHNRKTAKERSSRRPMLYDENGMPVAPDHHWNEGTA